MKAFDNCKTLLKDIKKKRDLAKDLALLDNLLLQMENGFTEEIYDVEWRCKR